MRDAVATTPEEAPPAPAGEMRYIARQPILDKRGRVHGYALLFDTGPDGVIGGTGRDAARVMLDDTVLFGLERLTQGLPAFIKCTSEVLSEQLVAVLPPETTVLSIPESIKTSPHLVDACHSLKDAGFRLALMDYVGDDLPHPLLKLMDYVKVDLNRLNKAGRQRLREQLKGTRVAIMAEKVDTQEDYRNACAEGCTFFQGLYFCYPELIKNAKIPSNRVFHFEILRLLQDDFLDLKKLCPVIKRDASLVLRLLRLVNSPICAIRHEVTSIELAIIVLGELTFRRIANLAILREINGDQPAEILHMALVRARFCELAAGLGKVRPTGKDGAATARALDPSEQYLLGMFSLLPAMLRCPMETLAKDLPLRPEIRQALLGADNEERCLLTWIESHERNQTSQCSTIADAYGMNEQKLLQFYVDAVVWDMTLPAPQPAGGHLRHHPSM